MPILCDLGPIDRVTANEQLARRIVRQIASRLPRHVDRDELNADALAGLWMAAVRFNPGRGAPFEHFADIRIRGAVFDGLRRLHSGLQRPARAGVKTPVVYSLGGDAAAVAANPAMEPDGRDAFNALIRCAMPRLRVLAILRYVAELRPTEIAMALGVSAARVTQLHGRLVQQVRVSVAGEPATPR